MGKVRIGVIGVGGMGSAHCKKVQEIEETTLTCVCDVDAQVAEKKGQELNVPFFTDYHTLIDSGLVDAVIVATHHWIHPEVAIYAFNKGLHVLSEKPIAVTVSDADKMIKAAKKSKKVFAVMYQRRTEPTIRKALELIRQRKIGEIRRTLCVEPWYRTQAYYDSGSWRATWAGEGGGVMINQAPHGIDIFTLLGGLPSLVQAKTRTRLHRIEVEDEACALLEYPNGAWGYYYVTTCEAIGPYHMEFAGDKGKLVIRGNELELYTCHPSIDEFTFAAAGMWANLEVKEEPVELPQGLPTGHGAIIQNFARAILYQEPLLSPGKDGLNSVEFINAVILSGKTGKPVKLPVSRCRYDRLMEELKRTSKPKETVKVVRETDPKFKQG
ncbi:MAG: Gfo/Idh/MocA family oxidoreductase [Candidatus Omnitrophica bacterium]|nr:Gfo/Idh/MocA family oxidoreductase [Candidatus Omnitrophota bacterium]